MHHLGSFRSAAFAAACILLVLLPASTAREPAESKVPVLEPCVYVVREETTENLLRKAILHADVYTAADILSKSNETFSLAAGLTYTPDLLCFVVESANRTRDPDIVAYQALAIAAERTGNTDMLSTVVVESFRINCTCDLFSPQVNDEMRAGIRGILDDPAERRFILEFDGTDEEPEMMEETRKRKMRRRGRGLKVTDASPTNSFHCAYCQPGRSCRPVRWCP